MHKLTRDKNIVLHNKINDTFTQRIVTIVIYFVKAIFHRKKMTVIARLFSLFLIIFNGRLKDD